MKPLSGIYISRGGAYCDVKANAAVTIAARLLVFLTALRVIDWDLEPVLLDDLYCYAERIL